MGLEALLAPRERFAFDTPLMRRGATDVGEASGMPSPESPRALPQPLAPGAQALD